jgi:hypothetical protein
MTHRDAAHPGLVSVTMELYTRAHVVDVVSLADVDPAILSLERAAKYRLQVEMVERVLRGMNVRLSLVQKTTAVDVPLAPITPEAAAFGLKRVRDIYASSYARAPATKHLAERDLQARVATAAAAYVQARTLRLSNLGPDDLTAAREAAARFQTIEAVIATLLRAREISALELTAVTGISAGVTGVAGAVLSGTRVEGVALCAGVLRDLGWQPMLTCGGCDFLCDWSPSHTRRFSVAGPRRRARSRAIMRDAKDPS